VSRLALIVVLGLAGCGKPAEGEPVSRVEIGKGALPAKRAATPCRTVSFERVPLTDCVADPARHTIRTALGPPYRSFAALENGLGDDAGKVAFAVNAGMFDEAGRPIGYYVEAGKRLKTLNRAKGGGNFHLLPNGVFFGSGGRWRVMASEDFYTRVAERPEFGTQSGPMLVIAGKLHPQFAEDGASQLIRNGVGVDARGRAHFVISEAPVSFGRFARFFRDRLETDNALYLDGTVSALWDPASGRRDASVPLGPLIVVENKEPAK
jgi:uncharacterized protein YigE (DUF2233 family)